MDSVIANATPEQKPNLQLIASNGQKTKHALLSVNLLYIYIHIYIYIYIYIYTETHTHTYTHIYIYI